MSNVTLDKDVRSALEARRGQWRLIAAQAEVSHSWISQFMRGRVQNPGFQTLLRLAVSMKIAKRPASVSGR